MAENHSTGVLHADPNETGVYEIESLCMNCRDNVSMRHFAAAAIVDFS